MVSLVWGWDAIMLCPSTEVKKDLFFWCEEWKFFCGKRNSRTGLWQSNLYFIVCHGPRFNLSAFIFLCWGGCTASSNSLLSTFQPFLFCCDFEKNDFLLIKRLLSSPLFHYPICACSFGHSFSSLLSCTQALCIWTSNNPIIHQWFKSLNME